MWAVPVHLEVSNASVSARSTRATEHRVEYTLGGEISKTLSLEGRETEAIKEKTEIDERDEHGRALAC
jgi:hypothetical protein